MISSNKNLFLQHTVLTDAEKNLLLKDKGDSLVDFDPIKRYKLSVAVSNRWVRSLVVKMIVGMRNILYVSGYKTHSSKREINSIRHIVSLFRNDNEKDALDRAKYLSQKMLPELFGLESPERPSCVDENEQLFVSEWLRFIRCRLAKKGNGKRRNPEGVRIVFSMLQLKRCFPELPKSLLYETAVKHSKRLAKDNWITETPFLNAIKRAVKDLFPPGWDLKEFSSMPKYTLSNKSCFEASRAQGGNQLAGFTDMRSKVNPSAIKTDNTKHRFQYLEENLERIISSPLGGEAIPIYSDVPELSELSVREKIISDLSVEHKGQAAVAFVADPAKWRPVTKSNWTYGRLKPFQKAMHGHLRQFDQFRLIGKTLTKDDLEMFCTLTDDEEALSGDFEAATDNIHHDASCMALGWIINNMRSDWATEEIRKEFAKSSMTHLEIHYPKELTDMGNDLPEFFIQLGGQLMGSLLSFIVLCVINYAMWCEFKARTTGKYPKATRDNTETKEDFVRINGDDIGGIIKKGEGKIWEKCVRAVGLTPSMGKNYISNEFVTLNSQMYLITPSNNHTGKKYSNIEYVPWVNLALLSPIGTTKQTRDLRDSMADNGQDPLESLGKMHDDFVSQCIVPGRASSVFIHSHRKELKFTFRNLFGPVYLGGLGATPVEGERGSTVEGYTARQLMVASLLETQQVSLPAHGKRQNIASLAQVYGTIDFPDRIRVLLSKDQDSYHLPAGMEDVTEKIQQLNTSWRSFLSWISPLALQEAPGTDWSWWKKINKKYSCKKTEKFDYLEFISAAPREVRYLIGRDLQYNANFGVFNQENDLENYLLEVDTDDEVKDFASDLLGTELCETIYKSSGSFLCNGGVPTRLVI